MSRLTQQMDFILAADRLKTVQRQTLLADGTRHENSAEHSWHIALAALVLAEHAAVKDLDLFRVVQMLLVHDLVEIDAGDTYCYDEAAQAEQPAREAAAADRLFALLPADQAAWLRGLWDDFQALASPEARFAHTLDRVQPLLNNFATQGRIWRAHGIPRARVAARQAPAFTAAPAIAVFVAELLEESVRRGYLGDDSEPPVQTP